MKVTVLMENTALEGCGLTPEHGLSLYIEYRGKKLLLDAGATEKFADNAQALGVDLAAVELAVLSQPPGVCVHLRRRGRAGLR